MKLLGSVMVLGCHNVARALDFYQQAFRFIIIKQRKGEQGPDWVYLRSDDVLLMLEKRQVAQPEQAEHSRLYFFCDDVPSLHHFLRARGIEVTELRTTDYAMQEFDTIDPEGHKLTIGQRITEK